MDDEVGQCEAFVPYMDPIDRLVIADAGTPPSSDGTTDGVALVSALTLGCGCQCAEKAGPTRTVVPLPGRTDRCRSVPNTKRSFVCDFRGAAWCETALSTRWLLLGAPQSRLLVWPAGARLPGRAKEAWVCAELDPDT